MIHVRLCVLGAVLSAEIAAGQSEFQCPRSSSPGTGLTCPLSAGVLADEVAGTGAAEQYLLQSRSWRVRAGQAAWAAQAPPVPLGDSAATASVATRPGVPQAHEAMGLSEVLPGAPAVQGALRFAEQSELQEAAALPGQYAQAPGDFRRPALLPTLEVSDLGKALIFPEDERVRAELQKSQQQLADLKAAMESQVVSPPRRRVEWGQGLPCEGPCRSSGAGVRLVNTSWLPLQPAVGPARVPAVQFALAGSPPTQFAAEPTALEPPTPLHADIAVPLRRELDPADGQASAALAPQMVEPTATQGPVATAAGAERLRPQAARGMLQEGAVRAIERQTEEYRQATLVAKETDKLARASMARMQKLEEQLDQSSVQPEVEAKQPTSESAGNGLNEILLPEGCTTSNCRSKVVLLLIEIFGLYLCGIDRCYLGSICTGILKCLTISGFGIWAIVDWMIIVQNAMEMRADIDTFGLHATFSTTSIEGARPLALILVVLAVGHIYVGSSIPSFLLRRLGGGGGG